MSNPKTVVDDRAGMPKPKALGAALLQVRNLVERLRAGSKSKRSGDFGVIAFVDKSLGGIHLAGDDASQYRACLESLVGLHDSNPDLRALSRDAVDGLLKKTILRAIRPRYPRNEDRAKFSRRLGRELLRLRSALTAPTDEWLVTVKVHGFEPSGLPFRFGSVEFEAGTPEATAMVAAQLEDYMPKRAVGKSKLQAEQRMRAEERKSIQDSFAAATIARSAVRAVDDKAARHLGLERVRRTIDVLNFFAPYFHRYSDVPRAFVAPEGKRTSLPWVVRRMKGGSLHWSCPTSEVSRFENTPIAAIDLTSARAVEIGLDRASAILETAMPNDLETRIANAMVWAGRASVEPRHDLAFLLFAISLEALLTKPSARGGVTDRLRLRVTHLIGIMPATRKRVFELMGRIYTIRSNLVHSGDATDLTDADLQAIRTLVQCAITGVLTDSRFKGMRRASELEQWLDDQLIAAGAAGDKIASARS
ncbi:MAG: hypothetical protein EPO40_18265 [Myxococcaceae bacterium]|nr:MAG: hypothetical protein EPO40_18265 [Myxococcaceae bacterium]